MTESGKVSTLFLQFTNILAAVNLRKAVTPQSAKKGGDTAREMATVSFHSLRHSAVALLKAEAACPTPP